MAEKRRYYWIKLKENFFDLETIDWLMSQKNGCEYIVLYQKLCLLTANKGGKLAMQIGEMIIPYDVNKIARDTKFSVDTVIVAMELFKKIGLIYEQEDGVLKIPYVEEMVGSETTSAQRVREYRQRKALQCNNNVTQEIDNRDKSIDKDLELEKDKDNTPQAAKKPVRHKYGEYKNVLLSDEDMEKLQAEFPTDYQERIERLSGYIASTGKSYKNHLATIRNWARKESPAKGQPSGSKQFQQFDAIARWAMEEDEKERNNGK